MNDPASDESRFPLNRVLTFLGPHFAVVSAAISAWLIAKVNVLGIKGLDQNNAATWIAGAMTFLAHSGLTWLGQNKWLTGHHIMLAEANSAAAGAQPAFIGAGELPAEVPPAGDEVHFEPADLLRGDQGVGASVGGAEPLVSDAEEFAAPPPSDGDPEARVTPDYPEG